MATDEIEIKITAEVRKALDALVKVETQLSKTEKQSEKTGKEVGKTSAGIGSAIGKWAAFTGAIAGSAIALKNVLDESIKSQKITQQLNAVLRSTGGVAGVTSREVKELSTAFAEVTTFEDDAITAAQSTILTYTNIGKSVFPRVTAATLDMAKAMGTDLNTAAFQLGKILDRPLEGMDAMTRLGIRLTDEQKKQVQSFAALNDVAGAQGVILAEVEKRFGGSAAAAAAGVGIYDRLANQWGDIKEAVGDAINTALIPLLKILSAALAAFLKLDPAMQGSIGTLAILTPAVIGLGIAFGGLPGLIAGAVGALAAITIQMVNSFEAAKRLSSQLDDNAVESAEAYVKAFRGTKAQLAAALSEQERYHAEAKRLQADANRTSKEGREYAQIQANNALRNEAAAKIVSERLKLKAEQEAQAERQAARQREEQLLNAFYNNDLTNRLNAARKAEKEILENAAATQADKAKASRERAAVESAVYAEMKTIGIQSEKELSAITKSEYEKRAADQKEIASITWKAITEAASLTFQAIDQLRSDDLDRELAKLETEKNARLAAFEASTAGQNEASIRLDEIRRNEQAETLARLEEEKQAAIAAGDDALAAEKAREQEKITLAENEKTRDAEINANKAAIEAEYAEKSKQAKIKAAEGDKAVSIVQSLINTALGVTQALAGAPPPFSFINAGIVGALGLAQTALIASKQIPAFAEGGIVTSPTLAQVGEGGNPEAIIPLKNGSVPVLIEGGGNVGGLAGAVINVYPQSYGEFVLNMNRAVREGRI